MNGGAHAGSAAWQDKDPRSFAPPQPLSPAVAQRAIEWLITLQSVPVSPSSVAAWQQWRAADPEHERAWQRIEAVNSKLRHLGAPERAALAQAVLTAPASPGRRQALGALAALVFAGGVAWAGHDSTTWRSWTADHRSTRGERRRLTLDDGTQLVLNSDSAINVAFSAHERRLRLIAGEVLISTARDDAGRPFLVETTEGEARALGTRFTVHQQAQHTGIAVFEGAVRVTPRGAPHAALVLQAGEQARYGALGVESAHAAEEERAAWADGFIIARSMRLADFVAELDRHSTRPLGCDPAVADVRVSGSFPLADIDRVLHAVASTLDLQIETVTRLWGWQTVRITLAPRRTGNGSPHG
ncbi:MAG: FecR domain-containing protein [Moraxellaceae bacterium]|nr:FecR domain-containing protein [Moraxellaceae bacterium]